MHEEKEEERYFRQREYSGKMMSKKLHILMRQHPKDEGSESKSQVGCGGLEMDCDAPRKLWKEVWTFILLALAAHF